MLGSLLLHQKTKKSAEQFIANPSHAVLVAGPAGAGKRKLVETMLSAILKQPAPPLNSPNIKVIVAQDGSISIEQTREVNSFLKLKTTGKNNIRRAVIIFDAHKLTPDAGNTLLKVLEEPPADTIIFLTSEHVNMVLPTIASRCQRLQVLPINLDEALTYFGDKHSIDAIRKAFYISEGYATLLRDILESNENLPITNAIDAAKQLLTKSAYARLVEVDGLSKNKEELPLLLEALRKVARAAMLDSGQTNNNKLSLRWLKILNNIMHAQKSLRLNSHPKLILTNLFLNIG